MLLTALPPLALDELTFSLPHHQQPPRHVCMVYMLGYPGVVIIVCYTPDQQTNYSWYDFPAISIMSKARIHEQRVSLLAFISY